MGLRYAGIRVRDIDRSVAFYTRRLGLKEQGRGRATHGGVWVLLVVPRTRQRLELNWYPPTSPFATRYVPGDGLDHLGFRVPDAAKVARRLARAGVRPALLPTDPNGMRGIYYFLDPDGNWIELF